MEEHAAEKLRRAWRELQPTEALWTRAEAFLMSYPLKAADALQLTAAWNWCSGEVRSCAFLLGAMQLGEAARQVGFPNVTV